MSEPDDEQDRIDSTAAAWIARLGGGPLSRPEQDELESWLAKSPLHAAAFDEARAAWTKMGQLRFVPSRLAPDGPAKRMGRPRKSGSVAAVSGAQRQRAPGIWLRAGAVAACLMIVVGGALLWLGDPSIMLRADYSTAPGARESITLADGSSIDLGPASAIAIHYTDRERRVELLTGLAYFAARPLGDGERRPFVVAAANGTARALGTRFMVERLMETVDVTVIEHRVEVTLSAESVEKSEVVISPGQAVRYAGSVLDDVRRINPDHALAWQRGRLIFDDKPLADVVDELNRYRPGRIVIADPALASRRISGVFETDDPDAVLATIVRDLHIGATSLPPLITVLY